MHLASRRCRGHEDDFENHHGQKLTSLKEMAKRLEPQTPTAKVSQEKRKIPDLEVLTSMLKDRCPNQEVPNTDVCKQISDVFFKLAEAHKAYGEAAQGLAELASSVTPEQYQCS